MDTTFKTHDGIFNYRVGAIILNGTKALLAYDKRHGHCYTVGGRAHFGESSEQAVLREIYEETGVKAELDRLAVAAESFFYEDGRHYHEISFYYLVKPFDFDKIDFSAVKRDGEYEELCWVDLGDKERCGERIVYPLWFADEVLKLPDEIKHIVLVEEGFKMI